MNETMTLVILAAFDVAILGFGIYLFIAGCKMQKEKEIGTFLLAEEEVKRCRDKNALAEFFCWREKVLGGVFMAFGAIRLIDKFILKIGGVLDIVLMVVLLAAIFWFFKCLQNAREKFLA